VKNKYLRHARISEHEFRSILELFCADVEALKVSRITEVNKNTTHRIYGLLRKRVVELAHAEAAPFAGCVEVDESYFGPRRVQGIRFHAIFSHLKETEWRFNHRCDNL
jgi:transposase